VDLIHKIFKSSGIRISAQKYLEKFYSSFGFVTLGKEYLEDGIPHVAMVMKTEKIPKLRNQIPKRVKRT
jgi:ElaA protein